MKKFTKGCLMTALVLFLVGLILSVVCGLLGGFRQLNKMGISDWPVSYYRNVAGDWGFGRFRSPNGILDLEELEDVEDIEDIKAVRKTVDQELEKKRKELEGKKEQIGRASCRERV